MTLMRKFKRSSLKQQVTLYFFPVTSTLCLDCQARKQEEIVAIPGHTVTLRYRKMNEDLAMREDVWTWGGPMDVGEDLWIWGRPRESLEKIVSFFM